MMPVEEFRVLEQDVIEYDINRILARVKNLNRVEFIKVSRIKKRSIYLGRNALFL